MPKAKREKATLAEAVANIDDWYIPLVYDCLWFVYECLEEAGVDFDRSAQTPNGAFDENIQYTNVIAE